MMWTLIIPQDVFCVINVQPFPFTIQTFRLPLGNYSTNKCGFFLQNLMFFLHLCTLMHVFAKITLFKHVYIKNWLNINQCKNMIHAICTKKKFGTHSFSTQTCSSWNYPYRGFIYIQLHSNPTELFPYTNSSSKHGMASYNNVLTIEYIYFFSINIVEVCKLWNCNACYWIS
jgi:hypothetical protein